MENKDDFLVHYGVLGMKWGVRNAETQRKYAGGKGRKKAKTIATRVFKAGRSGVRAGVEKVETRVEQRREVRARAEEAGVSTRRGLKEFKRLRADTLKAHDPELVEKGMHTLTDSELNAKLARLNTEKQIRDLAANKRNTALDTQKKREEVAKAHKERKASGLGSQLLKSTYNATINYAGKKAVDTLLASTKATDIAGKLSKKDTKKGFAQSNAVSYGAKQVDAINTGEARTMKILGWDKAKS